MDLPEPETPVRHDEEAEREIDVEFLEVVAGGSADGEELFGGLAAGGGDGDGFLAGEPGESAGIGDCEFEISDF